MGSPRPLGYSPQMKVSGTPAPLNLNNYYTMQHPTNLVLLLLLTMMVTGAEDNVRSFQVGRSSQLYTRLPAGARRYHVSDTSYWSLLWLNVACRH